MRCRGGFWDPARAESEAIKKSHWGQCGLDARFDGGAVSVREEGWRAACQARVVRPRVASGPPRAGRSPREATNARDAPCLIAEHNEQRRNSRGKQRYMLKKYAVDVPQGTSFSSHLTKTITTTRKTRKKTNKLRGRFVFLSAQWFGLAKRGRFEKKKRREIRRPSGGTFEPSQPH